MCKIYTKLYLSPSSFTFIRNNRIELVVIYFKSILDLHNGHTGLCFNHCNIHFA